MSHGKCCLQCRVCMIIKVTMGLFVTIPFHSYTVWVDYQNPASILITILVTFVCLVENGAKFITNTPWVILAWVVRVFNLVVQ